MTETTINVKLKGAVSPVVRDPQLLQLCTVRFVESYIFQAAYRPPII